MTGSNARAEQRVNARMRVRVRAGGPDIDAQVLDASSKGMLLSSANPPQRGEIVEVLVGNQEVVGQVKWSEGTRFGIRLGDRIDAKALAAGRAGAIRSTPMHVAAVAEPRKPDETGVAFNFIFFAAAAIASIGFLAIAIQRSIG